MPWSKPSFVLQELEKRFLHKLKSHFPSLSEDSLSKALEITVAKQENLGHYQFNGAMKLSKLLDQSPRDIAQKLLLESDSMIESSQIAGPGFINIFLKKDYLESSLQQVSSSQRLGISLVEHPKKVIVEFSSPNTAKELHVGHLRSTIIGDSLARLFEFLGHDVLRLNHIGDWGTPFGMLICYLEEHHQDVLSGKKQATLSDLASWYKESRKSFDQDPAFKKRSQEKVVLLQKKEQKAYAAWLKICEISRQGYQEIYDLLDVKLTERGESFYNDYLANIVQLFEDKNLITVSDGAKCVFLPDFVSKDGAPLPTIIQKSDGGYNYATTDLAALFHRIQEEKADLILYVVDNGQSLHFQMFFKAAQLAGFLNSKNTQAVHVPFGLVLGADGTKFKTRAGDSEKLIDLIYKAIDKAKEIILERGKDQSPQEALATAKALGVNAIKYADLSSLRTKDYQFSYDKMLQFEGNTAAFLMYAYVRIQSIQAKASKASHQAITLIDPSEVTLALHLLQLADVLSAFSESLLPNRLCDYLYQLAIKFHAFFRDCPVLQSEHEGSRLALIDLVKRTFEIGFSILGLKTVQRM